MPCIRSCGNRKYVSGYFCGCRCYDSCGAECDPLPVCEKTVRKEGPFFKVLGNPARIRILLLLMGQDSCVGDLAEQLGITQSAVSHQLNLLKSNKLVCCDCRAIIEL
ncbi:ArsR family transcriptional regulator [bacterium 1XD8-76]|nr:ArsR family transcriptional regulator [bacterium 1XD8-76]